MRWIAVFLSSACLSACASRASLPAKNFIADTLAHPVKLGSTELQSRYWAHRDFLVHFVTNVNEQNKSQTPVIYVHGLGGNLEGWMDLIKLNHPGKTSRPYYAIDLPPFGKSAMQKSAEVTIRDYTQILEYFAAMTGAPKVNLACHSLGGQVCISFALARPDQVQLLTLISPAGVYAKSAFVNYATVHYAGINIGSIDHPNAKTISDMTWFDHNFQRRMITDNPIALIALESFRENFRTRIQNLKVRALILWGRNDAVFSFENGLYLKENVENSTLYILEGAGHTPMSSHADLIAKLMKKYL